MKEIHKIIKQAKEELEGADDYISNAAKAKANGDIDSASEYAKMADAELAHALSLQAMAAKKVAKIKASMPPAAEPAATMMQEMWDSFTADFVAHYGASKNALDLAKK